MAGYGNCHCVYIAVGDHGAAGRPQRQKRRGFHRFRRPVRHAGDFRHPVRLLRGRGILLRQRRPGVYQRHRHHPDPVRVQPVHDPHREIPGAGRGPLYRRFHRRRHHWGKLRPVGPDSGGPVLLHLLRRGGGRPDGVHGHGVPRAAGGARMGRYPYRLRDCADLHHLRGYGSR